MDPNSHAMFQQTRLSLVHRAFDQEDRKAAERALNELCAQYWEPIYAYARHNGLSNADAQDCVQVVLSSLTAMDALDTQPQGVPTACFTRELQLRGFLMQQVKDYLSARHQRAKRPKHGGHLEHVSFDYSGAEERLVDEAAASSPEAHFDYRWARCTLDRTLSLLRHGEEAEDRGQAFEMLLPFLDSTGDYATLSATLGQTEATTRKQVQRLRDRYKGLLKEEVARTLVAENGDEPNDTEVIQEMRCLLTALRREV